MTTHQEKSVGLSDPIPVTGDLMCQMNWFLAANEGKDLSFEDLIAHVNLLSVGASFSGEGVFIIDVSDATCREKKICLTESERDAYFKDREEYVASHFDLSVPEYHEWIRLNGLCLCGGDTITGKPCKNHVSRKQRSATEWKATHRTALCPVHSYMVHRGRKSTNWSKNTLHLNDLGGALTVNTFDKTSFSVSVAFGTPIGPVAAGFAFDASHSYTLPIFAGVCANMIAASIVARTSDAPVPIAG